MAKCKNCKNIVCAVNISSDGENEFEWCPIKDDCPDIEAERECDHYEVMCNADRIRNMTDEELAYFLFHIGVNCALCHEKGGCESHRFCDDETLEEWLQSPVEV